MVAHIRNGHLYPVTDDGRVNSVCHRADAVLMKGVKTGLEHKGEERVPRSASQLVIRPV
jgi:hypothetical protein